MRNLKRALSLAMASVMLLGMMVVGAGAVSFPDVDSSNDLEAIEVMNAVGVMTGDTRDGVRVFRPNDTITRNEIAKVMALLLKLTPEDYAYAATPFTDVPEWAHSYVAACYANKITNGTSATTYSGDSNVTAIQAARMMLRALGYLKHAEDDGDDWILATATQASKIGLFDGVSQTAVSAALTRNQVATMAVNALEATMVEDKSKTSWEVSTSDGTTVTQSYVADYRPVSFTGGELNNYTGGAGSKGYGTQQLCEFLYGADLTKTGAIADDFFRPGSLWRYKGKEVVGSPDAPMFTYTSKPGASTLGSDLKGYTYAGANVYVDGVYRAGCDVSTVNNIRSNVSGLGNGTKMEIYTNNNTVTDIIVVRTYLAQANEDYDAEDNELDITLVTGDITLDSRTLDGDDFGIENYKKDDYILITASDRDGDSNYKVQSVEPATVVSGLTVSAWESDDYVTAGGTQYKYNAMAAGATAALGGDYMAGTTGSQYNLQKTQYTLILDRYGYVLGVKATADEEQLADYLFVKDASVVGFDIQAKAVFMDGTSKTVTVSKLDTYDVYNDAVVTGIGPNQLGYTQKNGNKGVLSKNLFYTYTVDKSGNYELKTAGGRDGNAYLNRQDVVTVSGGDTGIDPDQPNGLLIRGTNAPTQPANSKTVFVAKDKAFVGVKNAPKVTMPSSGGSVFYLLDVNSNYVLAAYTATKGSSSTDASEYVYILNTDTTKVGTGKDSDGNTFYIYDVVQNGKKGTINANTDIRTSGNTAPGLYKIGSYADGYADLSGVSVGAGQVQTVTGASNTSISHKNGTVRAGGQSYVLADDSMIVSIDTTDDNTTRIIAPASLNNLKAGVYDVWAVQVSGTDTDVKVLYVVKLS